MTDQQRIAEIAARCEAATPGPWLQTKNKVYVGKESNRATATACLRADAAFIAHSRVDIPFLLAEIDRLTERWIPVTERLPEHRKSVLVYCPEPNNIYCGDYHGKEDDVFRDTGKWYYFGQGLMREIDEEVTHWMPLPAALDHIVDTNRKVEP